MCRVGVGNMKKRVYDPNNDGLLALAQLVAAVCSETEADNKIAAAAKKIATGSYAGNDADGRQITVGFKCSMVNIIGSVGWGYVIVPNLTQYHGPTPTHGNPLVADVYLHATDGFVVSKDAEEANISGQTYYYWAVSE